MGTSWKLNGVELTTTTVTILPDSFSASVSITQDRRQLHNGSEKRTRAGKLLPTLNIQFDVIGYGEGKFTDLDTILDIVEDDDVWTLEAPSDHAVTVYRSSKRAALATDSIDYTVHHGKSLVTVRLSAIVDGIWISDGGTYCQTFNGNVTRNTASDYDTVGGVEDLTAQTLPLIKLPEQSAGYPKGIHGTTFALTTLDEPVSIEVDGDIVYAYYDLTDFIVSPLTSNGDVGLFEICSSPESGFLGGTTTFDYFTVESL